MPVLYESTPADAPVPASKSKDLKLSKDKSELDSHHALLTLYHGRIDVKVNGTASTPKSSYSFVNRLTDYTAVQQGILWATLVSAAVDRIPIAGSVQRQVLATSKRIVPHVLKRMEPYHERLDAYGNRAVDIADGVAIQAHEQVVSPIKTLVANTLKRVDAAVGAPARFMATTVNVVVIQPAKSVTHVLLYTADGLLVRVEQVVDYILPPLNPSQAKAATDTSPKPFTRAAHLTVTVSSRVWTLLTSKSQNVLEQTDQVLHVRATLELLKDYQLHLETSSQRLRENLKSAELFLLENMTSAEKRQATAAEVSEYMHTKREQLAKPTVETVLAVQARLIESMAEFKSTLTRAIQVAQSRLPPVVTAQTAKLVAGVSAKWEMVLRTAEGVHQVPAKATVDGLLVNLSQLTQRASQFLSVSTDGLSVLDKAKQALSGVVSGGRVASTSSEGSSK